MQTAIRIDLLGMAFKESHPFFYAPVLAGTPKSSVCILLAGGSFI
jgi:hypothetical protein